MLLLQLTDQGIICISKVYHTWHSIRRIIQIIYDEVNNTVVVIWKLFTIAVCLDIIQDCLQEMKSEIIMAVQEVVAKVCE